MLKIQYPKKSSEFELQASLYAILRFNHKIDVRGELVDRQMNNHFNKTGKTTNRFDLVVFNSDKIAVAIIECKNDGANISNVENGRQFKKYSFYEAKLFYCNSFKEIENLVNKIKTLL